MDRDRPRQSWWDETPSIASLGGRTFVAWRQPAGKALIPSLRGGPTVVAELTMGDTAAVPVAYGPAEQVLATIAAAEDALLVGWKEIGDGVTTWRVGVRRSDGRWRETRLDEVGYLHASASDGRGFAAAAQVGSNRYDWAAFFVDATGNVRRGSLIQAFLPSGIASNGGPYVAVGVDGIRRVIAATLDSTTGSIVKPVILASKGESIADSIFGAKIVAHGRGYLVVWQTSRSHPCNPTCGSDYSVHAVRLDPDLNRLDAENWIVSASGWLLFVAGGDPATIVWTESNVTRMRTVSVLTPRRTSQLSKGEGTPPAAFW
jgi:hypothetical protein